MICKEELLALEERLMELKKEYSKLQIRVNGKLSHYNVITISADYKHLILSNLNCAVQCYIILIWSITRLEITNNIVEVDVKDE